jgi:hypothetical protein
MGILFIIAWYALCNWAERLSDIAHPGLGASFLALIPIFVGWVIFLVVFPIVYILRSFLGLGSSASDRGRIIAWVLWGLPLSSYVLVVTFAFINRDFSEAVEAAALFFPLLCWRIYASILDTIKQS